MKTITKNYKMKVLNTLYNFLNSFERNLICRDFWSKFFCLHMKYGLTLVETLFIY